jgi:hypothetical protein
MMPESPIEDVLIVEEGAATQPAPTRPGRLPRSVVGLTLIALPFGLAATTIALGLASRPAGRRRGAFLTLRPRITVFAPSVTITLFGSTFTGRMPAGRAAPFARRRRPAWRRAQIRQRARRANARWQRPWGAVGPRRAR